MRSVLHPHQARRRGEEQRLLDDAVFGMRNPLARHSLGNLEGQRALARLGAVEVLLEEHLAAVAEGPRAVWLEAGLLTQPQGLLDSRLEADSAAESEGLEYAPQEVDLQAESGGKGWS